MTLEESIKHCEDIADYDCFTDEQRRCSEEHRQLADWLRELKERREKVMTGEGIFAEPFDRKAIEDEVWGLIKDVNYLGYDDFVACFNGMTEEQVFELSYQEAKKKYEAWRKQKDGICVGDEVVYHGNKYVVGYVGADEVYHIVDRNWIRVVVQGDYQIFKTGRHFDEVEELLKKMKEQ